MIMMMMMMMRPLVSALLLCVSPEVLFQNLEDEDPVGTG